MGLETNIRFPNGKQYALPDICEDHITRELESLQQPIPDCWTENFISLRPKRLCSTAIPEEINEDIDEKPVAALGLQTPHVNKTSSH
ncbi:hypothetical protein T265_06256 [Opisthorchis viverrini]|uniref:Uncharacterized protein n=1 Tax=Opisthorchis viverrini TaxID=6198 RepID=A0A074ZT33_OPIVI|nr:hypothetical protein T265_06256 [Opisthorchis viverrini]KER26540.1 hypothetical protein T265_06256 [Opisthorchis viverrini]